MSRKLLKNTATVGGMTLISRVLGFVRDMVFARIFGAGLGMDAFFVAFKIPNFLRRLFAEGAFSQAFVPVLSEYKARSDQAGDRLEVQALADRVAGTLAGVLALIALAGVAASPLLVMVFAPGFLGDEAKFDLTAHMLRLTFPYIFFISLVSFAAGILNTYGRFGAPAFAPVLLNVVLIAAAWWLAPHMAQPVVALAWGVLVAGLAQLLFLLPALKRIGLLPRPRWGRRDPGVRRIMKLMLPAIFGSSVVQINLLFDTLIASFLVTGSVSWLYYSDRLVEFPLGVFGVALGTVLLPSLSRHHARQDVDGFTTTLDWALRWVFIMGLPAAVGLFFLAGPLLSTLFQYGAFSVHDAEMARLSLMAYTLGLPGFMLVKVLAPGFYARQDTRTPVRVGVIAMLANMGLNVAFVVPMVMWELTGPHLGLALATSLSAYLNAGLLYRHLQREGLYRPGPGWGGLWLKLLLANGLMAVLLLVVPTLTEWSQWGSALRALSLAGWVGAGGLVYLLALYLQGLRLHRLWSDGPGTH